jgi:hypothetical protein
MNRDPNTQGRLRHNIAAIRKLLLAPFTAGSLRRFREDEPVFHPVLKSIPDRGRLEEVVDLVIGHCRTRHLVDELLVRVKETNPRQYARFELDFRMFLLPASDCAHDLQDTWSVAQ